MSAARIAVLAACFFLSGAAGLLYQVLWLRSLTLIFGHGVYAVTTVLAAFMTGLALGSLLFARRCARLSNLLRVYGVMEIGVAATAAAVPLLLWAASLLYLRVQVALGSAADRLSAVQFLLVFAVLIVPTTLMGGTLPVLAEALAGDDALVRRVGLLYSINTLGAVLGTVLAGYVLLPALGTRRTTAVAVAVNLIAGALALLLARRWSSHLRSSATTKVPRPRDGRLILAALAISSGVAMLYEVTWTRALALVVGSSTYAFTAMLVAFLVGIAAGSALYVALRGRAAGSPMSFGIIQLALAVTVGITLALFGRLPELFLVGFGHSQAPGWVTVLQLAVASGVLLPSTLLVGASFPCALAVATRADQPGHDVGHVYAASTLGAVVGTVLTGFVLVPVLGVHGAIKLGVVLNVLIAGGLAATRKGSLRWVAPVAALGLGIAVCLIPLWDLRVMAAGTAIYAPYYAAGGGLDAQKERQRVVFYRDGATATVAVIDTPAARTLRINGKTDASDGADLPTQVLLAQIPMLVHPDPRRVMVLGLGGGITAGSAATHTVESLNIVELEPAVVEAARFFSTVNGHVLDQPNVRVVVADGRTFLLTTPGRYDVIVSEPSNPWIAGMATLFSVEFFDLARARLRPGGLMAQWVQGYSLSSDDFAMIVRTFRRAFPATSIWQLGRRDFLLLGAEQATPLQLARLRERVERPAVRADLDRAGLRSWPELLGLLAVGPADTATLAGTGRLNDDDGLPLEFSAPRALHLGATTDLARFVQQFRTTDLADLVAGGAAALDEPGVRRAVADTLHRMGRHGEALAQYREALRRDGDDRNLLMAAATSAINASAFEQARDYAVRVLTRTPDPEAYYVLGVTLWRLGRPDAAAAMLTRATALDPADPRFRSALAEIGR